MALTDRFGLAYFFFAIFLLWMLVQWFMSEFLSMQKRNSKKSPRHNSKLGPDAVALIRRKKHRKYQLIKWGGAAFFAGLGAICMIGTSVWEGQWELKQLKGVLYPANDSNPSGPCDDQPLSESMLRVYFGSQEVITEGHKLDVVSLVRNGEPDFVLLGLRRTEDGTVSLKANVIGEDNKLVAQIDSNHFEINRNKILDSLSPPRPDRSTIVLTDESGNRLRVRLINKYSVSFAGRLYFRPGQYVQIDERGLHVLPGGGGVEGPLCFGVRNSEGGTLIGVR